MASNEQNSSVYSATIAFVVVIVSMAIVTALFLLYRYIAGPSAAATSWRMLPRPAMAAVELQPVPVLHTYRSADGSPEQTCPVCLSDMVDGEIVRVLPACMHYFHATCVDEWLRSGNTCPLCRAEPAGHAP